MSFVLRTLLHACRAPLLGAWEGALQDHLAGAGDARSILRERLPRLLDALAACAGEEADQRAADLACRGVLEGVVEAVERPAQLRQLLDELRVLRAAAARLLVGAPPASASRPDAAEGAAASIQLGEVFDRAIAVAVEAFTARQERRLARLRGADEALRAREDFLRRVIDATPSMVLVKDDAGRFTLGNAALARVYGTTVQGLIGKTDADFNPDAGQVAAFLRADREVMTTRREKLIPVEPVRTAAGEDRWFTTVKVPLVKDDGTCREVLIVASDVTDRKNAEEALRRADRQKDEFLAMLAHELRNPLAAIGTAVQVIRTRLEHGRPTERPLEVLERQIRNCARLLDDLLDVSRITRGLLHLRKERVRLDAVVASALDAQRPRVEAAGHQLTVSLPDEPVFVDGDPTRLEQVISNLVDNAAKYTPGSGHIALTVERRDGKAELRVADDGIGIPPDLLPRVFDIFVQAEQTLARTKGGLGLGLTLVRRLVELHGGAVEVRSEGAGRGSEFVVRLPARPAARRAPGASPAPPGRVVSAAHRRVLLVEDSFDQAELLSELLAALGHEVTVAHDGPAALAAAARVRPDVVLLDIGLPGMDGYEVARRLREGATASAPVLVAITGYGQDEDRRRSGEAGFAHHLTKPFEASVLERLLAEVPPQDGAAAATP